MAVAFTDLDGKRRRIRLGRIGKKKATVFGELLQEVVDHLATGRALPPRLSDPLYDMGDKLYRSAAKFLPIPSRQASTLGELLDLYIEPRRGRIQASSIRKLEQTKKKLEDFFGKDKLLRSFCRADADRWCEKLVESGLREATIKTECGNAKAFFAGWGGMPGESPFDRLQSGSTPRDDAVYVPSEHVMAVLEFIDDPELKAWVGLCRFAGTRKNSEPPQIRWSTTNLQDGFFFVPDQKRRRYKGKTLRKVPIDGRLLPLLQALHDTRDVSDDRVFRKMTYMHGGHWEKVVKAIKAAGLEVWPDMMQSLRASYDMEILNEVPDYAATAITGHSREVQRRHYANIAPDHVLQQLAGRYRPDEKAHHKAHHPFPESVGSGRNGLEVKSQNPLKNQRIPEPVGTSGNGSEMGVEGFEPPTSSL